jgi:hypothetical protein
MESHAVDEVGPIYCETGSPSQVAIPVYGITKVEEREVPHTSKYIWILKGN